MAWNIVPAQAFFGSFANSSGAKRTKQAKRLDLGHRT